MPWLIPECVAGLSSTKETQFPIGPLFLDESGQHIFTCSAANTHAGVQYMTTQDVRVVVGMCLPPSYHTNTHASKYY